MSNRVKPWNMEGNTDRDHKLVDGDCGNGSGGEADGDSSARNYDDTNKTSDPTIGRQCAGCCECALSSVFVKKRHLFALCSHHKVSFSDQKAALSSPRADSHEFDRFFATNVLKKLYFFLIHPIDVFHYKATTCVVFLVTFLPSRTRISSEAHSVLSNFW